MPAGPGRSRRERNARILGVATAIAAMTAAGLATGWPAPGISVALGVVVYGLARSAMRGDGEGT